MLHSSFRHFIEHIPSNMQPVSLRLQLNCQRPKSDRGPGKELNRKKKAFEKQGGSQVGKHHVVDLKPKKNLVENVLSIKNFICGVRVTC